MDPKQAETPPALWKAVWQLADAWSETPVVQEVAATLPRNRPVKDRSVGATGIPALLHHLEVSVGGLMHPLMYGSRIPVLLQDPMIAGPGMPHVDESDLTEWLQNASMLENAHRLTLGWLRSSLPRYPILRAPQLAPGTPLTTYEMTTHFIWPKHEFAEGFGRHSTPPHVPDLLGADAPTRAALEEAARELANQLREAPAWIEFNNTSHALDDETKSELREARRDLTGRLAEERLDEHEQRLALPRSEYRAHTTADVIETLTGTARSHAVAFNNVHMLLTLTACDIFSDLALYGEPWPIPVLNVEAPEPGQPIVEFESAGAAGFFLDTGQVLWLGSNAVPDAVRLERKSFKMDLAQGTRDHFSARVLQGTAEAWPASSATLPTSSI